MIELVPKPAATPRAPCPPPDRLLAFASGELSDDQSASVEAHIDSCIDCRAALSSAARGDTPPRFGRYRIDTVLGSGGMGIVYRAWDPQLARAVAIKVVRRAADDALGRARLIREAQSLARLSHPNVCHVYDVGTDGDEVWVAMELIDGMSLRDWAAIRKGNLVEVLLGAAEGIAAAHAAGLVHRDVKPENVLVTRDGRAIVTDFGLARGDAIIDPNGSTISKNPTLTATGAIVGTPAYLAPEQLTGEKVDDRVDQFAWAVMAWELIGGSRPFPIMFALRVDAVRQGVTPPAAMNKRVAAVLMKAMQLVPSDRYSSMRAMIDALRPARAGSGARMRARLPIIVGVAALAAGGASVMIWEAHRRANEATQLLAPQADLMRTAIAAPTPAPLVTTPAPVPAPIAPPAATSSNATAMTNAVSHPATASLMPAAAARTTAHVATTAPTSPAKSATSAVAIPTMHVANPSPPPPAPPPSSPPSSSQQIVADHEAVSPLYAPPVHPYRREAALASIDAFCSIPADPAHPERGHGAPLDWGKVTSVAVERGSLADEPLAEPIITIAGHRGTYRIREDIGVLGTLQPAIGDELAVCGDREPANVYSFTGGATWPIIAALPLHGEPQLAQIAKYHAIHIRDLTLAAEGSNGRVTMASDHTYFLRTRAKRRDGDLFQMDRWTLEVPHGMPGADQLLGAAPVWILVEKPELRSAPDGGKPTLVLHAIAVLPEIFP